MEVVEVVLVVSAAGAVVVVPEVEDAVALVVVGVASSVLLDEVLVEVLVDSEVEVVVVG